MMKSILAATTVLLSFAAASATAQELSVGTYLHGNWTFKGTAGDEKVTGFMNVSPAADGASQFFRWTIKFPDETRHGSSIGGVDPDTGKIVELGFAKGSKWTNTYDDNLGDAIGKTTGTRVGKAQGKSYNGQITVDRKSKDEFTYHVESDDGNGIHFEFTRRAAGADGEAAFNAYAELAVGGTWTSTIDGVTYEDTYTRIQDGKFVMLTSKAVGEFPAATTILGVDPVSKKFTWWGFSADGTQSLGTSRMIKDGVWVGPFNSNGPDGAMTSRGRLTKVDDDTIRYEILQQTKDEDVAGFAKESTWTRKR